MKKILISTVIFISISFYCDAQKSLNENTLFFKLAERNIDYPINAIKVSLYGRIYTKFTVDKIGKIKNIDVFFPVITPEYEKSIGFVKSIRSGLSKIPLLGINYEGEYILPIAFIFTNHKDDPVIAYPKNRLPNGFDTENRIFLHELKITAKSDEFPSIRSAQKSVQIDEQ
jgi:hypothetical protein